MPSAAARRPGGFRGLALALLPAALLAAAAAELLSACNRKDAAPADPALAKGKALYFTHCIACHNANPAVDGTLGPAVKGSGLDLLEARVLEGTYPPGYAPKRDTKIMRKLPLTKEDVAKLHAFLSAP
jgi:mono/diheme cytochrome c family protein